ncbi:MAG: MarC family protein [Burkholderiaceae bacterium]|nr:MarC family protein [Burkholderiaceae bacterium]
MEQTFFTAFVTLFLIVDPVGSIPALSAALKNVQPRRKNFVITRECFFALLILTLFAFFGQNFMAVLGLSKEALTIGGGLVLLIIALRMLFPSRAGIYGDIEDGEPYIFPIAIPMLAGPSALTTVMLMVSSDPSKIYTWIGAITLAMVSSALIIISGDAIQRLLGKKATVAFERLMGLILVVLAVQMFLSGIADYVHSL